MAVVEAKAGSQKSASSIQTKEATASKQAPAQEAKLIIETKIDSRQSVPPTGGSNQQPVANKQQPTSTPPPATNTPPTATGNQQPATNTQPAGSSKLGSLNSLRQQFIGKPIESAGAPIPLNEIKLMEHWQQFTQQLKDAKNPANQSFNMATLVIQDHQTFEVQTNNNLEQKFIEGERRVLSEFLQQAFNNRQLLFTIVVNENAVIALEPVEKPVSLRDKYLQIVEQYPLVKELRDRLKLDVDN
ncbi:hypothetical protein [Paraflavitalea speifideaquila]|uniref:hypothetical protein n=1 Tax=Paraflavitalea speifideaquila TaxID=3076558 RepID=UPI0028EE3D7E|nr:hypothetical protein [Paraflavitalea speifideiaquila]